MDTMQLVLFLGSGSLLATLILGSLKRLLKDVADRWGSLATQILLFVICLLIALGAWAFQFLPANIMAVIYLTFSGAITLYEVFYKAIYQNLLLGNEK